MTPEDVEPCGRICYEAFRGIAEKHNFRKDFPVPEAAIELMRMLLENPGAFNVVYPLTPGMDRAPRSPASCWGAR